MQLIGFQLYQWNVTQLRNIQTRSRNIDIDFFVVFKRIQAQEVFRSNWYFQEDLKIPVF